MISPENQPLPEVQKVAKKIGAPKWWGSKKTVIAASAMGALVVGFLIFQNLHLKAYVAPPAQRVESNHQTAQTIAKTQSVEAGTINKSVEAGPVASKENEKPVSASKKLTITCQERTWVRIIIDRTETKEFMLNPEEKVALNAKKNFDLLTGNAGGVKLFYNGKDTGFTGKHGEVKHISLP
jgi:Domain of unknown function (DUF4115)